MTACAASKPPAETQTIAVYPVLPDTTCADNPPPPAADATDNELAAYSRARFDAGDDCRSKLVAVHDAQAKWPKTSVNQPSTKGN